MSDRHLEDWLTSFLKFTDNTEPPRMFRTWTAISVMAACLQRKCVLHWGSLDFYPNMYIVLVAPSGKARKGTAMIPGLKMLREMGVKLASNSVTRQALIRDLKRSNETEVDLTTGSMDIHASLTIFSKELTVFLGYQNNELMTDLTDWYDCDDDWIYRTKHEGVDDIKGVWVNLIGATTPDLIQSAMPLNAIGGGLTSRMIFVYEQRKGKRVHTPFYTDEELKLQELLLVDLERIKMLKGEFRVTKRFLERWVEWYNAVDENPPFEDVRFAGYFERRPVHVMKLSMILNASRTDEMLIDREDLDRAIEVLQQTEIKMRFTFSGVGKSAIANTLWQVMADVALKKEVRFDELMSRYYNDVDAWGLEKIIETMSKMNYVDDIPLAPGGRTIRFREGAGNPLYTGGGELSNFVQNLNEVKEENNERGNSEGATGNGQGGGSGRNNGPTES